MPVPTCGAGLWAGLPSWEENSPQQGVNSVKRF